MKHFIIFFEFFGSLFFDVDEFDVVFCLKKSEEMAKSLSVVHKDVFEIGGGDLAVHDSKYCFRCVFKFEIDVEHWAVFVLKGVG